VKNFNFILIVKSKVKIIEVIFLFLIVNFFSITTISSDLNYISYFSFYFDSNFSSNFDFNFNSYFDSDLISYFNSCFNTNFVSNPNSDYNFNFESYFDLYLNSYFISNFSLYLSSISTLSDYIELIYPVSFVFTSQTASYGIADQLYFSFFGNNHEYNQFYINGFKINSNFFPGTALSDFYLKHFLISLDPFDSKVFTFINLPYGVNFSSYLYIGGVWDIFFYTSEIIKFFTGSLAAIDRNPISTNDRRVLKYLFGFDFSYKGHSKSFNDIEIVINFNNGERTFLSYYKDSEKNTLYDLYDEDFTKFQFLSFYKLNDSFKFFFGFFYDFRTNYGSEFYFSIDQTKILNSFSFILGSSFTKNMFSSNLSFQFESNSFDDKFDKYEKELIDADGESLYIFIPNGVTYDFSLNFNMKYNFSDNFDIQINSDSTFNLFNPEVNSFTVNLLYYGSDFGRIDFSTKDTNWFISNSEVKLEYFYSNNFISIYLNSVGATSILFIDDLNINPLFFFYLDYRSDITFFPFSDFNIKIDAGKKTPSITSTLAKILNPNYLNGSYFSSDNSFLFHTNGNIDSIYNDLKLPSYLYFSISFSYKNSKNFYFNIDSQFRSFQNLFWVRAKIPGSYFNYIYNDQTLYYISDNDINYILTNYSEAINWLINNGFISDDYFSNIPEILRNPFYLGILFSIGKESSNFKINVSFWAYMVVGITAIGNGIFEDEIGIISENLSDPNLFIHGIGRMISDRSYVFKFNIAYKIFDNIWLSLIIRYRDGQPFTAFYQSITPNNYLNLYNQYMPGDNPFTGSMGRREDCIWEFNFDISGDFFLFGKNFQLSLVLYNFLDLAFELVEDVFNVSHRQPLEFQVPGTISFQISVNF
jgi:hypothetical protein